MNQKTDPKKAGRCADGGGARERGQDERSQAYWRSRGRRESSTLNAAEEKDTLQGSTARLSRCLSGNGRSQTAVECAFSVLRKRSCLRSQLKASFNSENKVKAFVQKEETEFTHSRASAVLEEEGN